MKKQKAKVFRKFLPFCFVFVFFAVSFNLFAQDSQELIIFAQKLRFGTDEEKRDILFEIRNMRTEEASRVAVFALKDSSEIVRATAVSSVIFLPSDEAVQILAPILRDRSVFVRRETAYALSKTRNPQAVRLLLQILQSDREIAVKNAAAIALGENGDLNAVDALTRILQRNPRDPEEFLRRSAARSIGQIAAFQNLRERIKAEIKQVYNPDREITLPKPSEKFPVFFAANNILIKVLQNQNESDDTRREAAYALGEIGDKNSIPILQSNLNSEDYLLVGIIQKSLSKIADQYSEQ